MRALLALTVLALTPALHGQTVLFYDDFESGISNWTTETLWHLQDAGDFCSTGHAPFPSGTKCAWFGNAAYCAIGDPSLPGGGGPWFNGNLTQNVPVLLPGGPGAIELSIRSTSEGEDGTWDRRKVYVALDGGPGWTEVGRLYSSPWQTQVIDLSRYAGHTVQVRFEFWTGDDFENGGFGWFVDDVRIEKLVGPGVPFCSGDGTRVPCPCGGVGAPGHGCPTSFNPQGAELTATGIASVTNDTLSIQATGVSQSAVTFFASQGQAYFGANPVFGDGLRCAEGVSVRARAFPDASGFAQIPVAGDIPLGQRFMVSMGQTRYVQALYRNAAPFCTSATFNLTNGLIVFWHP